MAKYRNMLLDVSLPYCLLFFLALGVSCHGFFSIIGLVPQHQTISYRYQSG